MSDLLENLNTEQLQAVTHRGGPLLIVAGAGTGKTTVITRRIAWLINQKLASADEILALTFTEKAASEMEERVELLMPIGYVDFWISTFHAFCERVLKQHGLEIGLSNDFELLDDTKQWVLIHKNLEKFKLDYYRPLGNPSKFISALLQHFSRCKDELIAPEDYLEYARSLQLSSGNVELISSEDVATEIKRVTELAEAFHVYQKLLLDSNYLDFGDLINYTLLLFTRRPNILKFYQNKFKHILVDEFQDTNVAQYELVKLLVASSSRKSEGGSTKESSPFTLHPSNLTVVGDDDQSIYKFRGASVSNILKFKDDYPTVTQITLVQNYRSSQEILDISYKLIEHNNPDRLEVKLGINKKLKNPIATEAGTIQVLEGRDLSDELDLVVKKVVSIKNQHPHMSWNDFAILIRSRSASEEILPRLDAAGIPFTYLANTGLYRKQLIADLISYLKLLYNYHDSSALYRVMNFPKFRLDTKDAASLVQYSGKHTLSLYETLLAAEAHGTISESSKEKIKTLLELLESHAKLAREFTAVEVFVRVVKDLGIAELVEEETLENVQNRELLEQFYKGIESFEQDKTENDKSVRGYLNELDLELQAGHDGDIKFDPNQGPESVKVLTVHAAKGLEFENVFVVNLVDQRFPTREKSSGIDIPASLVKDILPEGDFHLQEERRLFYVAITRAKKRLYLTWAHDYGGSRAKKPSLFLQETGLVPSEKVTKATGKVVFTRPQENPKRQVYQDLPTVFSYSAINTFVKCPLEYKYAHYLKLPLAGTPQKSFGITIHTTLQKFLEEYQSTLINSQTDLFGERQDPALPSINRLLELYANAWVDEWYPSKESKAGYKEKGKIILENFHAYELLHVPKPHFIEKRFTLKFGEYSFVGKIDRADVGSDGLQIIDYKTGSPQKRKGDEDVDQLRIYQLACQDQFGEKVASMCYWYLEKNEFVEMEIATSDELISLQEKLLATIHDIRDAVKYDRFSELHKKSKQHNCSFEDYI